MWMGIYLFTEFHTIPTQLHDSIEKLIDNPQIRQKYAHNAYQCGIKNHRYEKIHSELYNDLITIAEHQ